MRFAKMHGLGNDYVYIDEGRERVADASLELAARLRAAAAPSGRRAS